MIDYFMCLNSVADVFGTCWERRNDAFRLVLSGWQFEKFLALEYFYRPVSLFQQWSVNFVLIN